MKLSSSNKKMYNIGLPKLGGLKSGNLKMRYGFYLISVVMCIVILSGCSKKNQNRDSENAKSQGQETVKSETAIIGVLKEVNQTNNTVLVFDIENNLEVYLSFHGGTDVKDQYDQIITMAQIQVGEMVDIIYYQDSSKIKSMQISKQAWEYKKVGNLKIDTTEKMFEIGKKKYQYSEYLLIASEKKFISLIDLNGKDELTLKGIGSKVYSIMVTKGHGYIRLKDYEDFVGGSMAVGYNLFLPISEDMLIVVREGSYKITLENGELTGSKMVNVIRDQEVTVDMSEYRKQAKQTGSVTFEISPEGADLYIDEKLSDYSKSIKLEYGEYEVQVKLSGYSTYTGLLTVAESSQSISINLADPENSNVGEETDPEATAEPTGTTNPTVTAEPLVTTAPTVTTEPTVTADPTDTTAPTTNTAITTKDVLHKIYVEAPVGATIYLNGTKKGTIPLSFTKEIGTFTITLSKTGYVTKSYTVATTNDFQDVYFSFPNMSIKQ